MRFPDDLTTIGAFSCLLKLFHVAGFFNFSFRLHPVTGAAIGPHRWSTSVWWFAHFLFTVASGILAKLDYNCLFRGLMTTDAMNNYFKYVIGLSTGFVVLADSWCSAETHRSIWRCYRELAIRNDAFLGLMDRSGVASTLRRFMGKFLVIVGICIAVQYKAFYTLENGSQWQCFWLYNIYPTTISHLRHVFHLLHVSLMGQNLRHLRGRLDRLAEEVGNALRGNTLNPRKHEAVVVSSLERLEYNRSIYTALWQANAGINELFGFSQAFNVTCSFLQIAFDLYWVYQMWLSGEANIDVQMYSFVPAPVIVGFLMHSARGYHLAVQSLEQTMLDMPYLQDGRMVQLRGHFLEQLQRFRFRLTARNIFDFDNTLISKVLTVLAIVIVTYVVIFIEIGPLSPEVYP